MARYSEERKTQLLTVKECVAIGGISERTLRRKLAEPHAYVEYHPVKAAVGSVKTAFIDPASIGLTPRSLPSSLTEAAPSLSLHQGAISAALSAGGEGGHRRNNLRKKTLTPEVQELHQCLQPVLRTKHKTPKRLEAINKTAAKLHVSTSTVRRMVKALEKHSNSPYALTKVERQDKGKRRFPEEVRELVTAAFLNNKPGISARAIHRALKRAVPEMMTYSTKGGNLKQIEEWTVRAIAKELQDDPAMRLIFLDSDERKEYLRVYNGKVRALFANAQWQMDMTRCDVMVFNPVTRRFYRLRIHVIIDTFSGCIMGLAFSEDEDQAQTNIALLRALTPKTGKFAHLYPMYGTPNTIYWDNGKTYRSNEIDRIVSYLGIQSIHSKPRVSHTRGKIERFFGSMHQMIEKALPGYAGMNAVDRDSEGLRKLREATLTWADTGIDPGRQDRCLTEEEFKSIVLMWVLTEYHQMVDETGLTRQEQWLLSVENEGRDTLRHYDPQDLFMLFCRQHKRVVTHDGGIQFDNRLFKSPTGALAGYERKSVILMEDSFASEGWYGVVYQRHDGTYQFLGDVVPAPEWADAEESKVARQTMLAARKGLVQQVDAAAARNHRPELNIGESLVRALPKGESNPEIPTVSVTPAPLATNRARLAFTEEPTTELDGFLNKGSDIDDADQFMDAIRKALPARRKP